MPLSDDMEVEPVPSGRIINHRSTRFSGATQTCSLGDLSPESLEGLGWMYRWLETVGQFAARDLGQAALRGALDALITRDTLGRVASCAHGMTATDKGSIRVARVLHDLRGTALVQLMGLAELRLAGLSADGDLPAIAIFARDHAKVMRHSLIGLDEERRLLDSGRRLHGVANLRRRFPHLVLCNRDGDVHVDFAAAWDGDFAVTCPEFSTVLKQLYNLMNNAARHTADRQVLVRVYPAPAVDPRCVRLVVANALTPADRALLTPTALGSLWRGYTTTDSGLGLSASAALVAEAFGLEGPEQAVDQGYVGSRTTEAGFIAWLHWPVVAVGPA